MSEGKLVHSQVVFKKKSKLDRLKSTPLFHNPGDYNILSDEDESQSDDNKEPLDKLLQMTASNSSTPKRTASGITVNSTEPLMNLCVKRRSNSMPCINSRRTRFSGCDSVKSN